MLVVIFFQCIALYETTEGRKHIVSHTEEELRFVLRTIWIKKQTNLVLIEKILARDNNTDARSFLYWNLCGSKCDALWKTNLFTQNIQKDWEKYNVGHVRKSLLHKIIWLQLHVSLSFYMRFQNFENINLTTMSHC